MSTIDPMQQSRTLRQYAPEDESYREESSGSGLVVFAGVLLAMLGALNLIDGIAAVSNSTFFVNDAKYIFSDLNTFGWVLIAMGVVQGLTALGVFMRTPGARWVGVTIAALNGIVQLSFIPAYPFWSLALFSLDILVIYGLIVYGSRTSDR